jgi:beta-1,4-N-acetylglucosaminyltransferase
MADRENDGGQVLVTVGTTLFDSLVKVASSQPCRQLLADLGYSSLVIQLGRGTFKPEEVIDPFIMHATELVVTI